MYLLEILQSRNDPEHLKSTLSLSANALWVCIYKSLDLKPLVSKPYGTSLSPHPFVPPNPLQSRGCAGYGGRLCPEPCLPVGGGTPYAQPGPSTGHRHFTMFSWHTPVSPQTEEHFSTTWPDTSSAAQDCVHPARHMALRSSSWPMLLTQRRSVWIAASWYSLQKHKDIDQLLGGEFVPVS